MKRRLALVLPPALLAAALFAAAIAAGPGGGPRPAAGAWDVTDFGARGNGVSDDTPAVQRAIDAAARRGTLASTVYLPPGRYRVTKTLVVPAACGVTVRGGGMTYDQRATGHWGGTTLTWDGPAGGTLLRGEGATGLTVADLTLTGRPRADAPNRAGILLHCAARPGFGAGHWTVRNVAVIDAAAGLQFGTDEGDPCCSDSRVPLLLGHGCDAALRVVNNQGVVYDVGYLGASACRRAIDFDRGGNLHVATLGITGDMTEVRLAGGGPFVASSVIDNCRFEGGLKVSVGPFRRVEFRGLNEVAPVKGVSIDVQSSYLAITGPSLILSKPDVTLRNDQAGSAAYLLVRDAMCPAFTPRVVEAGCGRKVENRFDGWGTPAVQ